MALKFILRYLKISLLLLYAIIFQACEKEPKIEFTVDFSYEIKAENIVSFTNESIGEYYWMTWDFGNGITETTTNKNEVFEIYYAEAGSYNVSLKCSDYQGLSDTISQTIVIDNNDLLVSFSAELVEDDPNMVKLKNTTVGNFDSFKWKYRNREIENEPETTVYFPFEGSFDVEIEVVKNDYVFSKVNSIRISKDDPEYFNKLELVWADEFDGPEVDENSWTFETGSNGWGNNELQNYTNGSNAEIIDGILILTAKKISDSQVVGSYTSTRLITKNKRDFTYGRIEVRAKLPSGRGIWPAIWMLGSNVSTAIWPACGEIDIMEYVGYEPNVIHSTVHTTSGSGANGNGSSKSLPSAEEEFHVYGILWTEEKIVFYTDTPGNVTHTYGPAGKNENNWPFDLPQFFILNVAVGGDWGGAQGIDNSIFPTAMEVDYLRVYQEP